MKKWTNLLEINRNKNGDYYFIFQVPNVRNKINVKAKPRDEVIIVGVPKDDLVDFLEDKEYTIEEGE